MTANATVSTGDAKLLTDSQELRRSLEEVITVMPVIDIHTHLFAPQFGSMNLWGIDELLTYHYLIAELFRSSNVGYEQFWNLSKTEQADLIWDSLFVRNTPLSEATRGVVAVLAAFGLDARATDLKDARAFFRSRRVEDHIDQVLELSRVSDVVMTNDPLDENEIRIWESGTSIDPRFHAALRIDGILNEWNSGVAKVQSQGYRVQPDLKGETIKELRRFMDHWIERMNPLYLAVSLPDDFYFPEDSTRGALVRDVILPTCREHNRPFAMMIGVRRGVNPALRLAGDGVGYANARAVQNLCVNYPENRFLVTMLSRENQHELCVAARKFSNLMVFGCWWFLNNPSIVDEITRERIELLGTSFIPQHSDARVLDQLIYKWQHARRVIAYALYDAYNGLLEDGRPVTREEIERDVERLFSGNFRQWVGLAQRRITSAAED